MRQEMIENGIGYPIAHFVRVTFGNRLAGKDKVPENVLLHNGA